MGNKLESVRNNLEQARETHSRSLDMAQEDASEMKEIRSMLSEIPRDIDSDLLDEIDSVSEASTDEGVSHMETDVHNVLDEGTEVAQEVSETSEEQEGLSREAAESFDNVSDTRFGRSGAEGAEMANEMADSFSDTTQDAQESISEAEKNYEQLLQEVQG